MAGRVAKACRKAARIDNVRVLHLESLYAVRYLLSENSVEVFYLLFPDPWPKRRHQRRRVVTAEFLQSIHRALVIGGSLHLATDQRDYFDQIHRLANRDAQFEKFDVRDDVNLPSTKFERRFAERDELIYRLTLRKISPVT